jgi:type IV secretory pathway TraG/TraD family ATPase VirD4
MEDGKSYEGFGSIFTEFKMSIRMHVCIFLCLMAVAFVYIMLENYAIYADLWRYVLAALWEGLRTNNGKLFNKALGYILPILWLSKKLIFAAIFIIPLCHFLITRLFKLKAVKQRMCQHVRAARMVSASWIRRKLLFKDKYIKIGDLWILVRDETAHVLIVGKTRTGKSQLLKMVIKKLKKRGLKVIVYENKGDHLPYYYNPHHDMIYCPADERSIKWTLWNDVKTVMDIDQTICWSLIPAGKDRDPFWRDVARILLRAILYYLHRLHKGKVTNAQIWEFLTSGAKNIGECIKTIPEGKAAHEMISDPESKQTQGIMSTLLNHISCLEYIKDQDGPFSVREYMRDEGPETLFLLNTAQTKDTLKPLLSLMLDIMTQELLSMPEDLKRRRYFILDEFGTLHKLNSIVELLTRGGGMGASVFMGTQDIGQIDEVYGEHLRQTIINSCGTKVFLAVDETATKEYISSLIGDTEVSEVNATSSIGLHSHRDGKSITRSTKIKRLVMPAELDSLKTLTAILKLPAMPYTMIKIPLVNDKPIHEQVILREEMYLANLENVEIQPTTLEPDTSEKSQDIADDHEISLD